MCQMYFDGVNKEFLTNLSKNPIYTVKKHLTYEICQRKFNRVKGAYESTYICILYNVICYICYINIDVSIFILEFVLQF